MVQISTDTEALKPILENSGDSQLSEEDRLDQQTALALEEIDKLATTNVSNVAGGLEGAFARGGTEIDPSKIKGREGAREKQIERLVQDTTTRIDRVLKRSADSYTGTLPTAGTGNLERILWANRADQVKNKITAVSSTAKDSVLLAEGYDVFYNEARARVEQELEDRQRRRRLPKAFLFSGYADFQGGDSLRPKMLGFTRADGTLEPYVDRQDQIAALFGKCARGGMELVVLNGFA